MTSRNDQLWELISNHPMPADASGRSFPDQLMDEHGIRRETALTAIDEYRKFIYLCATREARNVPSKAVDLVWHQHMQHTRDYWDGLCAKIGKPLHQHRRQNTILVSEMNHPDDAARLASLAVRYRFAKTRQQ